MSKEYILEMFNDINHAYNDSTRLNTLSRMLDELVEQTQWHRVEDELPPKGFALIGARKRPPEISEDVWDMWVCEYDGEWGWQDMDGYALRGITHWMPIEPPNEEEQE